MLSPIRPTAWRRRLQPTDDPPIAPAAADPQPSSSTPRTAADQERTREIACALRLAQEPREVELEHALRKLGCTHRLTPRALSYAPEYYAMRTAASEYGQVPSEGCVCAIDGALAPPLLACMQDCLGPSARFWQDTGYAGGDVGYFSYVHALGAPAALDAPAAVSSMDELIETVRQLILPHFPEVARARRAEWWAHNRAHSGGHQLHFDSDDEGRGGVRNPIASTVLFLSAAGGPTLVTQQSLASTALAPHGWLAYPRENRLVAFDGRLLHCVIPGRAAFATDRRRITVMIAFWRDIRTRDPPAAAHGASASALGPARSFPDPRAPAAPPWSADFVPLGHSRAAADASPRPAPVVPVRPVWLRVLPGGAEASAAAPTARASASRPRGREAEADGLNRVAEVPSPLPAYDQLFQGL